MTTEPIKLVQPISESDWRTLNTEWESSGEPQKAFCSKRGINYAKFVQWRSKVLQKRGKSRLNNFSSVKVASPQPIPINNQAPIKLTVSNGLTITAFPDSDVQQLKSILILLGVIPC